MKMKLIVAGSRVLDDMLPIFSDPIVEWLDNNIKPDTVECLVSGHAKGPDRIGEIWARKHSIQIVEFIPDWDKHGNKAGPLRNKLMGDYATHGVVFWDGVSRGSQHMHTYMLSLKKPCIIKRVSVVVDA